MSPALITRIAEEHAAVADSLPSAVMGRERRRGALEALAAHGLPTSRDENWKYANLRALERVRFTPADPASGQQVVTADKLPSPVQAYARYTFVDGTFVPELSSPEERDGITVRPLRADSTVTHLARLSHMGPHAHVSPDDAGPTTPPPDMRFALLNEAFATDTAWIRAAAGTDCPTCVELVFVASADAKQGASYPRVELQVEAGARLSLIERHISVGSDTNFVNAAVNIDIGRGASLHHYRLQQAGARAIWIDTLSAVLAQDAVYRLNSVALGGLSARSTMQIQLAGERSDVSILMASLGDKAQVQDAFALVEHVAAYARTEQAFRGISSGRARVGFNGKVVVRAGAHGTDSRQSLRGLLAGPEAEIDVRPQLEIYTDDVRCSHGATAGKLDENMLFYLLSRGLDRETAQRLLKWAFLEDVVSRIDVPELRKQIELSLAGQMKEAAALKELL
jgi:Fe-S cluster assembly protein SufD